MIETDIRQEGMILPQGPAALHYVTLYNDTVLVTEKSLLSSLELTELSVQDAERLLPERVRISYRGNGGLIGYGILLTAVPAVCISLIELNRECRQWPLQAMNASLLLVMLCSRQLQSLIAGNAPRPQPMKIGWKKKA